MAISTPFKSGTVSSVSGTTFTATASTFNSTDVGRLIVITSGSGKLQHRKIVTYNNTTTVTVDHAWDATPWLDTVADVNPINGDTFVVSYLQSDATFTGEVGVTVSGEQINISAINLTGGAYIHIVNAQVDLLSASVEIGVGAGMIFGWYEYIAGEDAQVRDSCHVIDASTSTAGNQMGRGGTNGADFGMLDIYGGTVLHEGSAVFWRTYYDTDSSDCQCRWVNVQFFGNTGVGGRVDGDRSIIVTEQVGARTVYGICNPRSAVSRVDINAVDCNQAAYVWLSPSAGGPQGRIVFGRLNKINNYVIRCDRQGHSGTNIMEVIGKKSEIDASPGLLGIINSGSGTHTFRYGNIIKPSFFDATTAKVTDDIKTVLKDTNGTITNTETLTTGDYTPHFDRHTDIATMSLSTGTKGLIDGTQFAPYNLTAFSFGKTLFNQGISLEDTFAPPLTLLNETLLTESVKATIDSYTALETAEKVFDRAYSNLYDNITTEEVYIVGRSGAQIQLGTEFGATTLVVDDGAVSVIDLTGTTLTIDGGATYTAGATTANTGSVTITGGTIIQNARYDCNISYDSTATTLTNITCTGTLNITTAGTYNFVNCDINIVTGSVAGVIINNSGSTITDSTDPNVTVNVSTTFELTGLQANSEVRVYEAGTTTEIDGVENSGSTFSTTVTVSSVDFVVFNIDYQPIRQTSVATNSDVSIPIQQVGDRVYENP
jgi:hypothetical protein